MSNNKAAARSERNILSCLIFFDSSTKVKGYSNSISKWSHQQTTNTRNDIDESQKPFTKWKKSTTEDYILYDSIYMTF